MRHDTAKVHRKKIVAVLVAAVALVAMLFFALRDAKSDDPSAKDVVKPAVETYVVKRGDMMRRVCLFGQTVPEADIDIAPKYAGRITAVRVKLGDQVRAGDVLIEQDTRDLELSIQQNHAAARQAEADATEAESAYEADYQKARADYERTKENDARYQELYARGAVSKLEFDGVRQQMINSKAALDTLKNQTMTGEVPASVESKRAAHLKTQRGTSVLAKQRDDLVLRAPRDGVIGYRAAEVGAIAQAGQKVLQLVDSSRMYVDCQLSEQDIAFVQHGLTMEVSIDSLGKRYPGRIIFVSPAADASAKSYSLRIELEDADDLVKAGMFARAQIAFLARPQTLFVPKESVIEKNGRISLIVINDEEKAEEREVVLGVRNDAEVEILSGLSEGERVAVSNLSRLKNGMAVELVGAGEPR